MRTRPFWTGSPLIRVRSSRAPNLIVTKMSETYTGIDDSPHLHFLIHDLREDVMIGLVLLLLCLSALLIFLLPDEQRVSHDD